MEYADWSETAQQVAEQSPQVQQRCEDSPRDTAGSDMLIDVREVGGSLWLLPLCIVPHKG